MSDTQSKYPSEVIDLPSGGLFYPKEHPLSSGTIEIKYMTAREEDILSSTNLIQKGIVLDKLVESLVISDAIDINDMLVGDKNAVVLAARIMAFGSNYEATVTCPKCYTKNQTVIDLAEINPKTLENPPNYTNSFQLELPASKVTITYRHLTHNVERKIEDDIAAYEKIRGKSDVNRRRSTEYKYLITAVDNDANPSHIRDFVDNRFVTQDARLFISKLEKNDPDMDTYFNFVCSSCEHSDRLEVPIDSSFLWPANKL